ncbi:MAG: Glycosyl hydrolases family 2, sugar binding domain [Lentisphaerae bacterium ADurb.Bin242]|nr:MAG: Glycosyl hydrolases family 2, sugar binding domain [Lentisphaerae bacterium ADurb.Bin242]
MKISGNILASISAAVTLAALPMASSAQAASSYLVRDSIPNGRIFLPREFQKPTLFAANELTLFIEKISGAKLETAWGAPAKNEGGIFLKLRPEKEWKGKEDPQAFTIEQTEQSSPRVIITGNTNLAVLYGAYVYLESLGVRFLAPGKYGTNLPRTPDIRVVPGKVQVTPAFPLRVCSLSSTAGNHFGGNDVAESVRDYQLYLLRNRAALSRWAMKNFDFGTDPLVGGHYIKPMTNLTREAVRTGLMERSPERFALITDPDTYQKRREYEWAQVCFTNEENFKAAVENAFKYCERYENEPSELDQLRTIPLGLSDCEGICECENCEKIAGRDARWRDRLVWNFWNRVAKAVNEKYPGRGVVVSSPYLALHYPPEDIKAEKNLICGSAWVYAWNKGAGPDQYPFASGYYDELLKISGKGVGRTFYCYTNFPWSPTPLFILDVIPQVRKLNMFSFEIECMTRAPYIWPLITSAARCLWEGKKTPREYLREYCNDYFGPENGRNVYDFYVEMTENAKRMEQINFGSAADTAYMLPPQTIAKYRAAFRKGTAGSSGLFLIRMNEFTDAVEGMFLAAGMYRAFAAAYNSRDEKSIRDFREKAEAVKRHWNRKQLVKTCSSDRTLVQLADFFLATDFSKLQPSRKRKLAGKSADSFEVKREVFSGARIPEKCENYFVLPEIWKIRLDVPGGKEPRNFPAPDPADLSGFNDISTWNMVSGQGVHSQIGGYLYYRLEFTAPNFPAGKKIFLRIGAVDDSGEFFLNGKKIGGSCDPRNWNVSFEMDVTDALKRGEKNILTARIYDSGGGEGIWCPQALYTK